MIFKHHQHETRLVTQDEIPQQYGHLLYPDAKCYLAKGTFGVIITQELQEKEYNIWTHHFFIKQPCILIAENSTSVVTINYMLEGTPYTKIPGIQESILDEGKYRLFFVPEITQKISFLEGSYNCVHLDFTPEYLAKLANQNFRLLNLLDYVIQDGTKLLSHLSGKINERIRTSLVDILWYTGKNRQSYVTHLTSRLLLQYVFGYYAIRGSKNELEQFIERKLDEQVTMEDLMKFCCKSERAVYRIFKIEFNTTPQKYIRKKRVDKAKQYLSGTQLSVAQIATFVGFESTRGFQKVFKDHTATTPDIFRKTHQK